MNIIFLKKWIILFKYMCFILFVVIRWFLCFFLYWDGKWYDSGNGNIMFENLIFIISLGWFFIIYGLIFNLWICLVSNFIGNLLFFRYVVFYIFCVF